MAEELTPQVDQLLLCQSAASDEVANAWVLVHPLSELRVLARQEDAFPHLVERWALYFRLTGLVHAAKIHVQILGPSTLTGFHTNFRSPEILITPSANPSTIEGVVQLQNIPLLEAGLYTVQLLIDGQDAGDRAVLPIRITGETIP